MKHQSTRILAGAAIILVGFVLLMQALHVRMFTGPLMWAGVLTFGGFAFAATGMSERRQGRVFVGSWAFLYGLYLWVRTFQGPGLLHGFPHIHAFALLVSLALSFLMIFVIEPRRVGNLVSALVVGVCAWWLYLSATNEMWADDLGAFLSTYWPIALILIGINVVLRRRAEGGELRDEG